ncbi:zinc finger BED domain-containing protein 6-like [Hyperolius riggenbachi]|uniref:zinc finger BED domain-containing protein 6-like n=1 Tax=Hyperolius riggenbachi TaxID=752182 RepID=UPI0035A2AA9F
MPQGRKNQAVESVSTLPTAVQPDDADFVEARCPAPAQNGTGFKRVPEIEIKLESSDEEEEEKSEESSTCSAPPQKSNTRHIASSNQAVRFLGSGRQVRKGFSAMMRPVRRRKTTSEVWQFFTRHPTNICRAICGLCKKSVSRGKLGGNFGTTALKRHLECKHPLEWAQRQSMRAQRAEGEEEEEETCEDEEERDESFQNTLASEPTSPPSTPYASEKIIQSLDQPLVYSQGPSSPKTYEIFDSSDEEEEGGENILGEFSEGIDRKRNRIEENNGMASGSSYNIDSGDLPGGSHGLQNAHSSSSFAFAIPDYSAVPLGARRRKSISAVWQFFCLDQTNICRAICTLCQTSVSRGKKGGHFGTSALMRHLEGKHPLEWGRGKLHKGNNVGAVEDEDDDEMEEQMAYSGVPLSHFGPGDLSLYSEMTDGMGQMHHNLQMEYDNDSEEALLHNDNASLPMTISSYKGNISIPADIKFKPNGKYPPYHPKAQAWNRNITELMCEMALPYSFIASKAFHRFMAKSDPQYSVPTKSFFCRRAVPQLYQAVCEKIVSELRKSTCPYVHMTTHVWSGDLTAYYLALTAHWSVMNPDADQPAERKYALLCIRRFLKDFTEVSIQQELIRQVNVWLTSHALNPGFFISNREYNLVQAIKSVNCTYIPCFTHSLNLLVKDFLENNRYIAGMLAVARKLCSHFIHSSRARKILSDLQYQNNLPKQPLKLETTPHWTSTFYMLQRLLEQQKAVQAYLLMHKVETVEALLSPSHWNLMLSLVDLLQPFEMAIREVNSNISSLSQVLPELRYLHIFLKQIRGHFESKGDANGVVLADSFALKLSTDYGVNEMFQREEYIMATLLDPRFKGRIEAILPPDSDIDHWKQVLVRKVKEVMCSTSSTYSTSQVSRSAGQFRDSGSSESELFSGKHLDMDAVGHQWRKDMAAPPLIHKEKSLIEHLESVGLLASKTTGASLSTESHSACVMVEKYLQDNKTIGAKDDPLIYWQKRTWLWPALTKLAIMYLTCPPSSVFAERVFRSRRAVTDSQPSSDGMEGMEHITFLKVNLENFPDYTPPPLISLDNETEQSDSDDGF